MTSKGQSKIVANLAPGAGVVTTRFQAQYIATEHGIVYLRNLPLAERAKALISIADPSVREDLERAAVKRFGIGFLRLKWCLGVLGWNKTALAAIPPIPYS